MIEIRRPRIKAEEISENKTRFIVEPLERGFGNTLGNSLRRVLLSSLEGAAITSVKIEGVSHEFSTIPGVKEDVTDIILNIKDIVLKLDSKESATLLIQAQGPAAVKAGDIKAPAEVEIVNPDLHVATLNKDAKLEMRLVAERGRGYISAERNKKPNDPIGVIPIDSAFSPMKWVTYTVENTRVGQRTDYDKLILMVETKGSMTPKEAVCQAAKIVIDHMNLFLEQAEADERCIFAPDEAEKEKVVDQPIEVLELSVRAYNCLMRHGIRTVEKLTSSSENDLMGIRNLGAKSIQEIKDKLEQHNLSLKGA